VIFVLMYLKHGPFFFSGPRLQRMYVCRLATCVCVRDIFTDDPCVRDISADIPNTTSSDLEIPGADITHVWIISKNISFMKRMVTGLKPLALCWRYFYR
jgi:hypothetical protein